MSEFNRVDTTANRIKLAMERAEKRQTDIVKETGIYKGTLSNYLKGKYAPKQEWVYKLAKSLDVSEMWLWGYDCPMERTVEQKKNDIQTDIILRMRSDESFMSAVEALNGLDTDQLESVTQMLNALRK